VASRRTRRDAGPEPRCRTAGREAVCADHRPLGDGEERAPRPIGVLGRSQAASTVLIESRHARTAMASPRRCPADRVSPGSASRTLEPTKGPFGVTRRVRGLGAMELRGDQPTGAQTKAPRSLGCVARHAVPLGGAGGTTRGPGPTARRAGTCQTPLGEEGAPSADRGVRSRRGVAVRCPKGAQAARSLVPQRCGVLTRSPLPGASASARCGREPIRRNAGVRRGGEPRLAASCNTLASPIPEKAVEVVGNHEGGTRSVAWRRPTEERIRPLGSGRIG